MFLWPDDFESKTYNNRIVTMNPSLVFGPVKSQLSSLSSLNTSNQRVRDLLLGGFQDKIPETGNFFWIDVRDLALAHVRAMERADAANKRFFLAASSYCNKDIVSIVQKRFPEYEKEMPGKDVKGGDFPEGGIYGFDNSRAREVLGIEFRGLEDSIVDLVQSLKAIGV
jgi:nucleoside-diphosphate-sugar epimerase